MILTIMKMVMMMMSVREMSEQDVIVWVCELMLLTAADLMIHFFSMQRIHNEDEEDQLHQSTKYSTITT